MLSKALRLAAPVLGAGTKHTTTIKGETVTRVSAKEVVAKSVEIVNELQFFRFALISWDVVFGRHLTLHSNSGQLPLSKARPPLNHTIYVKTKNENITKNVL